MVRSVVLESGGTNGISLGTSSGLAYAVTNSTVSGWCSKPAGKRADFLSLVDTREGRLVATTPTGRGPVWPLVDEARGVVYVATSDGEVIVHDMRTGARTGSVRVGGLPHDLGLDPANGTLVVSNTNDGSQEYVALVDASTLSVIKHLKVSKFPHRIALDTEARRAYVMSVETGHVTIIDTATHALAGVIETGGGGTMAYSKATGRIFVPERGAGPDRIRVVDVASGRAVGTIGPFISQAGHQAFGLALDDTRGLLFAALGDSDLIGVADMRTLQTYGVFTGADCVWGVQVDAASGTGVVTGVTRGEVGIFSLEEVARAVRPR